MIKSPTIGQEVWKVAYDYRPVKTTILHVEEPCLNRTEVVLRNGDTSEASKLFATEHEACYAAYVAADRERSNLSNHMSNLVALMSAIATSE